jgi:hypothetical protein
VDHQWCSCRWRLTKGGRDEFSTEFPAQEVVREGKPEKHNTLAPATIVGLAPLHVDGKEYPLEKTTAVLPDGRHVSASELSAESPLSFTIGDIVTVLVQGETLVPGSHTLIISPKTLEAGKLDIVARDTVS